MKLTRNKRNKVYKRVLEHVKKFGWAHAGFCYHLSKQTYEEVDAYIAMRRFPEIKKHKPVKKVKDAKIGYWFPLQGKKDVKREKILRQAIKETQD